MKLMNLVNIADPRKSMMLIVGHKDEQKAYDFENNCWHENALFEPCKIITFEEFKNTEIYKAFEKHDMITFSALHTCKIDKLKDIKTFEGVLCTIKVSVLPYKRERYHKKNAPNKKHPRKNFQKKTKN